MIKVLIPLESLLEFEGHLCKEAILNALEINTPIYLKMIDFENLNINFLKKGEILAVKIKGIKKTYLHKVLDDFNLCPFSDKNIRLTKYLAKF